MFEVYAFEARIVYVGKGRLGINIPSYSRLELERHRERSHYVVVYVYVPLAHTVLYSSGLPSHFSCRRK